MRMKRYFFFYTSEDFTGIKGSRINKCEKGELGGKGVL